MSSIYVGIDNGVTGSIGIIAEDGADLVRIPTKRGQSYQKKKAQITRIDFDELERMLIDIELSDGPGTPRVFIERPFTGQNAFKATISGMRCLEAVLIAVERLMWPYQYVDSKQWQREMLPRGLKGAAELKPASRDIGTRLFPQLADQITKQKDADGLLIAEWARRNQL